MILNYKNKTLLVLNDRKDLGPEKHYDVLFKNKKLTIAIQPSGKICLRRNSWIEMKSLIFQYSLLESMSDFDDLFDEIPHRECGPAYSYESGDPPFNEVNEFYIEECSISELGFAGFAEQYKNNNYDLKSMNSLFIR